MSTPLRPTSQGQLLEVCLPPCIQIWFRKVQNKHISFSKNAILYVSSTANRCSWVVINAHGFCPFPWMMTTAQMGVTSMALLWYCPKGSEVPSDL